MRRAPTVVGALCAAIIELVIVAAAGNQWVVDHLVRNAKASELPRNRELKGVLTTFPWRWTPQNHERMLWLGEIVAVAGLVIALFLLMLAFLGPMRQPRRFVPVWLGTWGIVVALTQVAAIGRAMLAYSDLNKPEADPQRLGRWWFGVFEGPTAATVLFGAASGLIVAIGVGIVAAATSRRADEDEDIDTTVPAGPDEVPEWSAALGAPHPFGATQSVGSGYGGTQAVGGTGEWASERAASEPTQTWPPPPNPTERLSGWPEPESTTHLPRAGEPDSTMRMDRPGASESTTSIDPPTREAARTRPGQPAPGESRGASTAEAPASGEQSPAGSPRSSGRPGQQPGQQPGGAAWSSVTQSTSDAADSYQEPPTEITLPRAPQPTSELPPPGSPSGPRTSSRLPLPEERESDES